MLEINMLYNQRTSELLDSSPLEQGGENSGAELVNLALGFLRRQYLVIIITTALAFATSVVFLKIAPPTYTAHVKVLFGNSKAPFVQHQSVPDETPVDLESQMEILKSNAVATSVISRLNLADDPEFNGKGGWSHSAWKAIRGKLSGTPQGRKIDPADELIAKFESRLSAWRVGSSTVIEVGFSSSNAERAADIANAIATAYIDDQLKAKADAHRTATAWLHGRLQELGHDILTAERAVNEQRPRATSLRLTENLWTNSGDRLNTRLVVARAQTSKQWPG
jgi:uncharacterized protein involved in exopolysaccharide biosynthesis